MTVEIFLRYIHFISIFTIVSTIVSEHLLLKKELTRLEIIALQELTQYMALLRLRYLQPG